MMILRYWKLIGLGVLCLLLAVQTVRLGAAHNKIERVKIDLNEARAERDSLIAAQKEAKRLNEQQVQRIEKEQQEISDDIEARYKADRDRLQRELAERLRKPAPPSNPGSPKAAPDVQGSPGTDETTKVCIPTGDYVHGAEVELQLDTLITLLERQLRVER